MRPIYTRNKTALLTGRTRNRVKTAHVNIKKKTKVETQNITKLRIIIYSLRTEDDNGTSTIHNIHVAAKPIQTQ
jgi:hypothetical protein